MRLIPILWVCPLLLSVFTAYAFDGKPLPDPGQLKQRAIANMKKSEEALERYSCIVREQNDELDGDGKIKKRESRRMERFFVHGMQIDHVLARDGKDLTGGDARKEQDRVDKEVKKYSDPKQVSKRQERAEKQFDMFLRAQRFTNGRREIRNGRSTVIYDLIGDPAFRPKSLEERFAQAVTGRLWMDEEAGTPVELRIETTRDIKIGGGLLANLHKGFALHLMQQRQPEGVWLTKSVAGNGDVRAGLFFHPRFRFKEELENCHLYSVESKDLLHEPK
ncbi:MAG: hypothetical protein JOY85_04725 [Acidobacteriaceae bacterium]|nr:hypothetical protein [Acidobacteriaceae bacterium]